ncbi:EamA family transporter [Lactobacillus johnsonii]|uniref:EamA family transporter n=2 Tax=Lactobacillus TaxID=1578 RepID=A0A9X6P3B7_LACJH|nr:EamA family transporter [Lactobacillus johnsonii]OYS05729.1 EamA family transporter [Lactobacillus johnsonii]OYS08637.1 EamA family transporter [Lactobacillus johnsonii]OYS10333.1 EamA family transporter [Lactobacillus johnsonii]OYS10782.1 EamA family transporter [Lactobacillus johnsonii]OYS15155.1 EamA family transporter [Lactobacillus johnsonii]
MKKQSKSRLWTILAALAAVMWGISGLFAESLFKVSSNITPIWLTQIRLIISGIVLLIIATVLHQKPFLVLKDKKNTLPIIAYGVFGLLPVQVFYFIAIEMANASIATILQFIGPFFVLTYLAVTHQQVLRKLDVLAAILAFIGVFLLSTHGNFNQLAITPLALVFGLLSAVGEASYTLIPVKLVKRVSSLVVTGWGMLFAGVGLMIVYPRFPAIPNTPRAWLDVSAIIIIGTIIPFQIMANALRYVKPSTVSLLDAFEPLSATVGSVLIFGLVMSGMDWLGTLLVIGAVLALNFTPKRNIKKS